MLIQREPAIDTLKAIGRRSGQLTGLTRPDLLRDFARRFHATRLRDYRLQNIRLYATRGSLRREARELPAMHRIARKYTGYGYRRLRILLRPEGLSVNIKCAHRLWKLVGLQLPQSRHGVAWRPRSHPLTTTGPSRFLAYNCVLDDCAEGLQLKFMSPIDRFTLESIVESGLQVAHIDPGKPWRNGRDESFDRRLHDNQIRPHCSVRRRISIELRRHQDIPLSGAVSSIDW